MKDKYREETCHKICIKAPYNEQFYLPNHFGLLLNEERLKLYSITRQTVEGK